MFLIHLFQTCFISELLEITVIYIMKDNFKTTVKNTYSTCFKGLAGLDFSCLKIFLGNTDKKDIVSHELIPPIRARYLRIIPESWNYAIALRVEIYGCRKSKNSPFNQIVY